MFFVLLASDDPGGQTTASIGGWVGGIVTILGAIGFLIREIFRARSESRKTDAETKAEEDVRQIANWKEVVKFQKEEIGRLGDRLEGVEARCQNLEHEHHICLRQYDRAVTWIESTQEILGGKGIELRPFRPYRPEDGSDGHAPLTQQQVARDRRRRQDPGYEGPERRKTPMPEGDQP
jgi:hypothetical protein